jgi:hypothetical protein
VSRPLANRASIVLGTAVVNLSYIVPIRTQQPADREFFAYLNWLSARVEVVLVDGSAADVFRRHAGRCGRTVTHLPLDGDLIGAANGKAGGVLTGLRRCSHEAVIIADTDVRYDQRGLMAMAAELDRSHVVRPQNYFEPVPWHACLDTARTLLNRVTGGDWPGTLGVRRSSLERSNGYDADVLFENLELVRTVLATGGIESCPLDLYVRRLPPTTRHFWSQRVRQAYDELARPLRLIIWLSVAPLAVYLGWARRWAALAAGMGLIVLCAEIGRVRAGGRQVFPAAAAFAAPLWVAERAVCSWMALAACVLRGGVVYHGRRLSRAATPFGDLKERLRSTRIAHQPPSPVF